MDDVFIKAAKIKLVIFDVDGVLTDGGLFFNSNGQESKVFHSRDGHGMKMLQNTGIKIGIITGRTSDVVSRRAKDLGIAYVYQGQKVKLAAYKKLINKLKFKPYETAYVGDDIVDLGVMKQVGLSIAVQDAHPLVKEQAHWITPNIGGKGAARDVCELIMKAQSTLQPQLEQYY
ncbi:3-deoxy-manno-octulosonate-8-phosphatase KdsC [Candidatus Nitrosacidococcus tergens]|uniref:3-deoxy-D-manno-octulosonate 8-phosphate phosphatase KdsC n=1 Tax=Candidatus Nitrosacidococcus tergens TaxID=553981 RepID=A0A7G1QBA1_9GAMM|nr:3-deoxy-manno-octulosonate-8-phosphatase KdsC [Candidatus Nitrosacidococcus tergens]CAB1277255.1 3-deoxy-D-manno-octulosonate 8-phosphate phosphatase [Candidatus Nitrosacidococcus tergens]